MLEFNFEEVKNIFRGSKRLRGKVSDTEVSLRFWSDEEDGILEEHRMYEHFDYFDYHRLFDYGIHGSLVEWMYRNREYTTHVGYDERKDEYGDVEVYKRCYNNYIITPSVVARYLKDSLDYVESRLQENLTNLDYYIRGYLKYSFLLAKLTSKYGEWRKGRDK